MDSSPYQFIASLLKTSVNPYQNLLGQDIKSWPGLLQLIFKEQLQGIAYLSLKNSDAPENVVQKCEHAYYATMTENIYRLHAIEELETYLRDEKLSVLIVKGAALLDAVYPDPGMRPMEDIDLVVRPEDFEALAKVLERCGFSGVGKFHHMFRKKGVIIDVHTSLLHSGRIKSRRTIFPVAINRIFKDSLPWKLGFGYIRRLDDATHIIYLAHHMIKHSFSKLIWIIDVHSIFENKDRAFWDRLGRKVIKYQQERPMAYMLYVLEKTFGTRPPVSSVFWEYKKNLTYFEKVILRIKGRGGSIGDLGNLLWMFCLTGTKERLRFIWESMFPSKEVLKRELSGASGHTGGIIYVARCGQLARRLIQNLKIIVGAMLNVNFLSKNK